MPLAMDRNTELSKELGMCQLHVLLSIRDHIYVLLSAFIS